MINLNMIFHVVVLVYRLVRIWARPSSLMNFGTANFPSLKFRDFVNREIREITVSRKFHVIRYYLERQMFDTLHYTVDIILAHFFT